MSKIGPDGALQDAPNSMLLPLATFEPGNSASYVIGLIPIELAGAPRLMFIFGKRSARYVKQSFVLDQHPQNLNFDTFARLFGDGTWDSPTDLFVGWMALRSLFGLPVTLEGLDSWDVACVERITQPGIVAYELDRWTRQGDWTAQLAAVRAAAGLDQQAKE